MATTALPTLEELRQREIAAQYADGIGTHAKEMAEIRRLRDLLTPAPQLVVVSAPAPAAPQKSVAERMGEQARAYLASGRQFDASTLKLLEGLAKH